MRTYFMKTARLGFSHWTMDDMPLAARLWGDGSVTRLIGAPEGFDEAAIRARLGREMETLRQHGVQYWPVFLLADGRFAGCCGLRPFDGMPGALELGIHLLPDCWGGGYASEACRAMLQYAQGVLGAASVWAGHHPDNAASRRLLLRLGFVHQQDRYYKPTGLMHPTYRCDLTPNCSRMPNS